MITLAIIIAAFWIVIIYWIIKAKPEPRYQSIRLPEIYYHTRKIQYILVDGEYEEFVLN